jgi:hypothetical protein
MDELRFITLGPNFPLSLRSHPTHFTLLPEEWEVLFIRLSTSLCESKASDSECGENVVSGEEGSVVGAGGNVTSNTRLSSVLHAEQGSKRRRRHRTLSLEPTNSEL